LDIQADFGRLPQEAETALFRIVQESLANIQRHSGTKTAKIHLRGDTTCVGLEVIDRGRGMDKKAIERGNGSGTRLGVGILGMRERMTQLGGKLEIESSSSGTTVRVSIPLRTESPMPVRILVADDHQVVRTGLRALLESKTGWQVCAEASNGREAVEKASQLKPTWPCLTSGCPC